MDVDDLVLEFFDVKMPDGLSSIAVDESVEWSQKDKENTKEANRSDNESGGDDDRIIVAKCHFGLRVELLVVHCVSGLMPPNVKRQRPAPTIANRRAGCHDVGLASACSPKAESMAPGADSDPGTRRHAFPLPRRIAPWTMPVGHGPSVCWRYAGRLNHVVG